MRLAACCVLLLGALGGCGLRRSPPGAAPAPAASRDASGDGALTSLVLAATEAEVLLAELALAASHDADVRTFATTTKLDHAAINASAQALRARLVASPADEVAAASRRAEAGEARRALRAFEGFAFDSAWSAATVRSQGALLALMDGTLLPNARDRELRALLQRMRPAVVAHYGAAVALSEKVALRHP